MAFESIDYNIPVLQGQDNANVAQVGLPSADGNIDNLTNHITDNPSGAQTSDVFDGTKSVDASLRGTMNEPDRYIEQDEATRRADFSQANAHDDAADVKAYFDGLVAAGAGEEGKTIIQTVANDICPMVDNWKTIKAGTALPQPSISINKTLF